MRTRRLPRCPGCGLYIPMCLCASLPRFTPSTRVLCIAHKIELWKSTNTAKLAARMLEGASVLPSDATEHPPVLGPAYVMFPSEHAISLDEARERGLRTLIVPDGTWAQAGRIARRHALCRSLPHVRLSPSAPSRYALRRNAREGGLCTFEAIAFALQALEGEPLATEMLAAFDVWIAASLRIRAGDHHAEARAHTDARSGEQGLQPHDEPGDRPQGE